MKIVKNPDGSMQRAAMTASALAKERRELKEQQQRTLLEAIPKDLSRHATFFWAKLPAQQIASCRSRQYGLRPKCRLLCCSGIWIKVLVHERHGTKA